MRNEIPAKPEAPTMQIPLDPQPHVLHSSLSKSTPRVLLPSDPNFLPQGKEEEASVIFCFPLLEIINSGRLPPQGFLLSTVFCITCSLSRTAT